MTDPLATPGWFDVEIPAHRAPWWFGPTAVALSLVAAAISGAVVAYETFTRLTRRNP